MGRWVKSLGAAAIMLLLVLSPSVANADQHPQVPDDSGNYAHCNVRIIGASSTAGVRKVSCQYGPTKGRITAFALSYTVGSVTLGTCTGPTAGAKTDNASGWVTNALTNSGGLFQSNQTGGASTACAAGYSATITSISLTVTIQVTNQDTGAVTTLSTVQAAVDSFTVGADAYPAYPTDYYPGGESGSSLPAPCFTATPARAEEAPVVFYLDAACSSGKANSTWAWTRTPTSDNSFSSSSGRTTYLTVDVEMSVSVKLAQTKGGTTSYVTVTLTVGGDSGDVEGDDEDCGAFWHVVCYAELLLIPDSADLSDSWDGLADSAETTYPLGPAIWVGGVFDDTYTGVKVGINHTLDDPDTSAAIHCGGDVGEVDTPVGELPVPEFGIPYDGVCHDSEKPEVVITAQEWSRPISTFVFLVGFLYFLKRQVNRLTGDSSAGEE